MNLICAFKRLKHSALKELYVPELRQIGFNVSYPHFRIFNDKLIYILGIMYSQ